MCSADNTYLRGIIPIQYTTFVAFIATNYDHCRSTKEPSYFAEITFKDLLLQVAYDDKAFISTLVVISSTSGFLINRSLLGHIIQILELNKNIRFKV